jgi:hypothetical protein
MAYNSCIGTLTVARNTPECTYTVEDRAFLAHHRECHLYERAQRLLAEKEEALEFHTDF